MSAPKRLDQASVVDAAMLVVGLIGFGLIRLGMRLMELPADAHDVWQEHDA